MNTHELLLKSQQNIWKLSTPVEIEPSYVLVKGKMLKTFRFDKPFLDLKREKGRRDAF